MRILVTGAAGFIGGNLVPALVDGGHDVYALVRDASAYQPPTGASVVGCDLARPLERAFLPRVDAIVHLAQANVPFPDSATELYRVNTASTQELLDHARRTGAARFLYASSASVYGLGDRPFREDGPLSADDFYAVTKLNAEQLVAAHRPFLQSVVFRFVAPYGPGQRSRLIPTLIRRVRAGEPITLNDGGRPRMNPIFVGDVVRVVTGALEADGHHVVNVAGDEVVSIRDLAELAGRAVGREPVFQDGEGGATGDLIVDTRRLHELLDLRPLVPLSEGIRLTAGEVPSEAQRGQEVRR